MFDNIVINQIVSGSTGNAYQLSDGKTNLLLECGIAFKKIQRAIGFKTSSIAGVLISHSHQDHCKAVKDMTKSGIDCYMSAGTAEALKLSGHNVKIISAMKQFKIGSFTILPFDTIHDCAEPLGFLLQSGKSKVLYLTDSAYVKYKFNGLTHIMIEANYQDSILQENIEQGTVEYSLKKRLLQTHLSLNNVIDFLKANDLAAVREIHLIHLSSRNADPKQMKDEVEKATGKPVSLRQIDTD